LSCMDSTASDPEQGASAQGLFRWLSDEGSRFEKEFRVFMSIVWTSNADR